MSSEARKIREQCARKFGNREKAYKVRIAALETELSEVNVKLADYERMQREYLKLSIFCAMSDEDKAKVLRSEELKQRVDSLAGMFGGSLNSRVLQSVFSELMSGKDCVNIVDVLNRVLKEEGS